MKRIKRIGLWILFGSVLFVKSLVSILVIISTYIEHMCRERLIDIAINLDDEYIIEGIREGIDFNVKGYNKLIKNNIEMKEELE